MKADVCWRGRVISRAWDLALVLAVGRAHVGVIASYVVVLWICETGGMVGLKGLLVFLTFACAMTAVVYLPWLGVRERRLHDERADLRQQLGELEASRGLARLPAGHHPPETPPAAQTGRSPTYES